ncbi:hypothetical protein FZC66_05255 [Priestia megaterium]|nr:hypothetical protein FZC66_05255 [Priestia megaterium]
MSVYVSSSSLILIPKEAIKYWKPYGVGKVTGAVVSGKECGKVITLLNRTAIIPFRTFFYRKHYILLFEEEEMKTQFELLAEVYRSEGYIFQYSILYDDHWSQILEGTKPTLSVNRFSVPIIQLDQTGEFDLVLEKHSVDIIIDDEEEDDELELVVHDLVLTEGSYFIGDPGFIENKDMLIEHNFNSGSYEIIYKHTHEGWLTRVTIQKKEINKQTNSLEIAR